MKKIGAFLLAVTFCFLSSTPLVAETPKEGGVMVVARGADGNGFDPAYETDGPSFVVCNNIYEALVKYT